MRKVLTRRSQPALLARAGVSLRQIIEACQQALHQVGGGSIPVESVDHLESLVVARAADGSTIRLKDVGYVQTGYDLRRSIADLDGSGEVVGGIVIMESRGNVLAVTRALDERIENVSAALPAGVEIVPTYRRASLVLETVKGFAQTLAYELAVTIVVVLLFLRNLRSAVAPISILVLATAFTAPPMAISARRSTCSRWPALPSRSARWSTQRS